MALFQSLFFLVFGVGLMLVALQGAQRGWLPNGPNGFKRGEGVRKSESPVGFWILFSLYFAAGVYLAVYALRLLTGHAASLPLK